MLIPHEEYGYTWAWFDRPVNTPYEAEAAISNFDAETNLLFEEVCKGLPTSEVFIKKHAAQFGWREELIDCAKMYVAQPLPLPIKYFEPFWWCYENSLFHAEATSLKYVEGVVVTPTGAYIHAWNSTGEDVYDYTYPMQHLNSYFGIEFPMEKIKAEWPMNGGLLGYLHEEVKVQKSGFAHRLLYG